MEYTPRRLCLEENGVIADKSRSKLQNPRERVFAIDEQLGNQEIDTLGQKGRRSYSEANAHKTLESPSFGKLQLRAYSRSSHPKP